MKEGKNEVTLLGNLGCEPLFHYGKNGVPVVKLRMAIVETLLTSGGKKKKSTQWLSVVAFDRVAEACNSYLKNGSRIKVHGRLFSRKLTYKSGSFCVVTTVVANDVKFLNEDDMAISNSFCNNLSEHKK